MYSKILLFHHESKTNFQLETKLILVLTIYKFRVSGRFSDFFNSEKCIKQTKIFPN
jgi:hypothetical protein